jgi:hypothetical protein
MDFDFLCVSVVNGFSCLSYLAADIPSALSVHANDFGFGRRYAA